MAMTLTRAPWPDPDETPERRAERVEREAAFIAASHAAIEAGEGINLDALLDEFDALDAEVEADHPRRNTPADAIPRR